MYGSLLKRGFACGAIFPPCFNDFNHVVSKRTEQIFLRVSASSEVEQVKPCYNNYQPQLQKQPPRQTRAVYYAGNEDSYRQGRGRGRGLEKRWIWKLSRKWWLLKLGRENDGYSNWDGENGGYSNLGRGGWRYRGSGYGRGRGGGARGYGRGRGRMGLHPRGGGNQA